MYTAPSLHALLHLRLQLRQRRRSPHVWRTSAWVAPGAPGPTASVAAVPHTIMAACGRLARRTANNTSGASAIEFAIVVSLFLVLALGVLAYGIYLNAAHSVAQLAADSARASIAGLNDTERAKIAKDHVDLHAEDFVLLNKKKVTAEAAPLADINQFQVVVRFDASDLPIWFMSGIIPLPPKTIERSASIKRGGY